MDWLLAMVGTSSPSRLPTALVVVGFSGVLGCVPVLELEPRQGVHVYDVGSTFLGSGVCGNGPTGFQLDRGVRLPSGGNPFSETLAYVFPAACSQASVCSRPTV